MILAHNKLSFYWNIVNRLSSGLLLLGVIPGVFGVSLGFKIGMMLGGPFLGVIGIIAGFSLGVLVPTLHYVYYWQDVWH